MINIAIVAVNEGDRLLLETIAQSDPEFNYIGCFSNEQETIEMIGLHHVNVVLIDIDAIESVGLESIERIKIQSNEVKFMVCSRFKANGNSLEAIKAGADAYFVLENSKAYQFIDAIKDLYAGERPISSSIVKNIWKYLHDQSDDQNDTTVDFQLSKRQVQIMELLHQGLNYREMSKQLFISEYTLKWHIHNIYQKLNVANRTEAINVYFKRNK
ncbi:Transcriptional regulatory protein LiaR [compost metagenome]